MLDLTYRVPFSARALVAEAGAQQGIQVIEISGVAIDTSVNKNGWMVDAASLAEVASTLIGKQIRVDHESNVESVKGVVKDAKVLGNQVIFSAEIATANPDVYVPILRGYVGAVSIGLDAGHVACSVCAKAASPLKICDHDDAPVKVSNIVSRELSIVASPAYEKTAFSPTNIYQALEASLAKKVAEQKPQGANMATESNAPAAPAAAPAIDLAKLQSDLVASLKEAVKSEVAAMRAEFAAKVEKTEPAKVEASNAAETFKANTKPQGAGMVAAGETPKKLTGDALFTAALNEMSEAIQGKRARGGIYKA